MFVFKFLNKKNIFLVLIFCIIFLVLCLFQRYKRYKSSNFISISADGRNFITLPNKKIFTPIGINYFNVLSLDKKTNPLASTQKDLEKFISDIAGSGINVLRIFLDVPNEKNEGWFENPVGVYNEEAAEKMSNLIKLCEEHDVYLVVCFFNTYYLYNKDFWKGNPYNEANGGPAENYGEMLYDEDVTRKNNNHKDVLEAYKSRIKFVIERWGNSKAIFMWDLYNDSNLNKKSVELLSRYVKKIDPHKRPVTLQKFTGTIPDPGEIKQIDAVSIRYYPKKEDTKNEVVNANIFFDSIKSQIEKVRRITNKPIYIGEYSWNSFDTKDHENLFLNALWFGVFNDTYSSWKWTQDPNGEWITLNSTQLKQIKIYSEFINKHKLSLKNAVPIDTHCQTEGVCFASFVKNKIIGYTSLPFDEADYTISSQVQLMPNFINKKILVEWIDPSSGSIVDRDWLLAHENFLTIRTSENINPALFILKIQ